MNKWDDLGGPPLFLETPSYNSIYNNNLSWAHLVVEDKILGKLVQKKQFEQ